MYYSGLIFYLLFLGMVTSYALLTPNVKYALNNETNHVRFCDDPRSLMLTDNDNLYGRGWFLEFSRIGILVIAGVNLLLEITQWLRTGRRYLQWTNVFDWSVYILAIIIAFEFEDGGAKTCWQAST